MSMTFWRASSMAIALAAAIAMIPSAWSQSTAPSPATANGAQYGPGMMGGYGPYHPWGNRGPWGGSRAGQGYGRYGMGYGHYGKGYGPCGMGYGCGGYGMGRGMMGGYGFTMLNLSADQHAKLAKIWNDTMNKAWPILGELRDQRYQMAKLMYAEQPNMAAINKTFDRITELQRKLLDVRLEARQQMFGILTEDQRKVLQEHRFKRWR